MSKKILIVEDDSAQRSALTGFLEQEGLGACSAASCAEAVRMLVSEKPDLVLLDVDLGGGMSGTDLAAMMRHDKEWSSIPVIVTSGMPGSEVRKRASSGEYAFEGLKCLVMSKPLDLGVLLANMRRMLA